MKTTYSWGLRELDELTGGIESTLILVYGSTGASKTTLSCYAPILQITKKIQESLGQLPENGRFYIIDGDGGFDWGRAEEIWRTNGLNFDDMKEKYIDYKEIVEFKEQHDYVKDLPKKIEDSGTKPLLISLDPVCAGYRGIILRTDPAHRAAMIGNYTGKIDLQLRILRQLAVEYSCPAIVSTWVSSPIGDAMRSSEIRKLVKRENITHDEAERIVPKSEVPFIGGRFLGFLPKLILGVSIPREGDTLREAYLFKSRSVPSGRRCFFRLSDKGISDVGSGK